LEAKFTIMRGQLRRVLLAFVLAFSVSGQTQNTSHIASMGSGSLPVLTRARDVQYLSAVKAKRRYPVKLRGVVTYLDTFGGNFADLFIQDETAGIFVFLDPSVSLPAVRPGQVVEVSGVSTPGDFSPCVAEARIRILGRGSLPKPRRLQFDELLGSSEDGQWAELEGVIRSGQVKTDRLFMNVATYGGTFLAIMPNYPENWATTLVDAKVAITGALAAIFNDRRQAVGFRLFVPGPSLIHVEEQPPADPFAIDPSTTISVAQFRPQGYLQRRIRIRATVTAVDPGRAVYV
jgi:hypothetical protein